MDNLEFEMLKALYDFQAVYPKTISFEEGEYFILYQTSARQRNWWQVVSIKGNLGFVPSNYVKKIKVEPEFLFSFLDSSIESLKQSKETEINGIMNKDELLKRLEEKKNAVEHSIELSDDNEQYESPQREMENKRAQSPSKKLESNRKSMSSPAMSTNIPPQVIPESPSINILSTKLNDITQDNSITSEPSETTTTPTTTTTSEDVVTICKDDNATPQQNGSNGNSAKSVLNNNEIFEEIITEEFVDEEKSVVKNDQQYFEKSKNELTKSYSNEKVRIESKLVAVESQDVYQVVDVIRRNTNLSFDLSCEALRVVLSSLEELFPNEITTYLEAVAVHVADKLEIPRDFLGVTHDAKRLQYIFSQLADCKNDSEQRTWMLYEDEEDIVQFLEELVDILKNADEAISCHEMSNDQYQSLINLVQYYQMETRWPIKRLLIKVFTAACRLDHIIVDILLTSVLPLEIVEDMKNNFSDIEKFKQFVKILTVIFSLGQKMPVTHQEQLNVNFVSFLFDIVEEQQHPEVLIDLVISLILAFNLQFSELTQNIVIEAMQKLSSAKTFTEKILLYLNREEDPVKILKHSSNCINSVLKIFIDIFSLSETANLFYTNDVKVLIDIMVRQLSDLSAGDKLRRNYLELCRRILRNTNYEEHTHRKQDLMKIFTRIFCEETECSLTDQQLVRTIANEFPQIFKA
ncbi:NCK-interacting protein with SH3 domain [Condylostylus longicornis]|uniref:NCK-interacting protein with SH3 domain n=1 Tax=Condylostylus longicornis TaxID=2530218 RepID=UPI00244DBE40|nr:NCK-interacting protein with SH3 domain [Condylostylus longicornis]